MEDAVFGVLQSMEKRWHLGQIDVYYWLPPQHAGIVENHPLVLQNTPILHILANKGLTRFCWTLLGPFDTNDLYIQILFRDNSIVSIAVEPKHLWRLESLETGLVGRRLLQPPGMATLRW
jgi:hypothetical protein